ncbi:DNA cytosine methyltransferase [Natrarchaeobius oligotrophus]|uniref:DNA (cytosine-5-)-methyltransferase n=1 Tax=Natrarchaeobius chitinivorans TaxID=1679083 RepID=A0A3N6N5W6_NATCH|nr:DNA cytosine methyltransferase [Natrarchaeobius chitinivorans]RQG93712.1 DNA cytosine methyltransferase [Natrarchaeobius chitinivorans]
MSAAAAETVTVVDLFAGAGGFSTGAADAVGDLREDPDVDVRLIAVNHDEDAIATHEANHSWADHYHAKVEELHPPDVVEPGSVDLLIAGPMCTHFSNARGGQPVDEQMRASPWHVLHWIQLLQPTNIIIENVRELRSWGPLDEDGEPTKDGSIFEQWVATLQALGYTINQDDGGEFGVILRAADYGDPTTRERLFVMGSRTRRPTIPEPTHSDDPTDELADWRPAADVIDWSDPGTSIWTRSRPLSNNTMKRIAEGIRQHCDPRLDPFADAIAEFGTRRDIEEHGKDVRLTAELQDDVVDVANLETALEERDEPFLVTGEIETALSVPMVMGQHTHAKAKRADSAPVPTLTKRGVIHHINADAFVLPRNMPQRDIYSNPTYDPDDRPFHTVTAKNHDGHLISPFLVEYYGNSTSASIDEPLPTVTTKARHALIVPECYPWGLDLRYRLLEPPETKQAQGFSADYEIVAETKKSRRKQIGNAVPVNLAAALCRHVLTTEMPSLTTYGAGIQPTDVDVPAYEEVAATDD